MTNDNNTGQENKRVSVWTTLRNPAIGMLLLGLLTTFLATWLLETRLIQESRARFDGAVRRASRMVTNRISHYAEGLEQTRGLFYSTESVTDDEFSKYVSSMKITQYYPGLQGIGLSVRKKGTDSFVNKFIEPKNPENNAWLGKDPSQTSTLKAAVRESWTTDTPVLSPPVRNPEDGSKEKSSFFLFVPLYGFDSSTRTPEERKKELRGMLFAMVRSDGFFRALIEESSSDPLPIEFAIYDGDPSNPRNMLFSQFSSPALKGFQAQISATTKLSLYGRTWTMLTRAKPDFIGTAERYAPLFVCGAGIAISLLAFWTVWIARERAWAETQARVRSESSAQRQSAMASLGKIGLSKSPDIEWIPDALRLIAENLKAEAVLLMSDRKIEGSVGQVREDLPVPLRDPKAALLFPANSAASAPVRWRENEDAKIYACSSRRSVFSGEDQDFLQAAANLLSLAFERRDSEIRLTQLLENSRNDVQQLRIEREIREKFVATLTHDLRNPLVTARMNAELILRTQQADSRERIAVRILAAIDRSDKMIQDLLDASRIRAGKPVPMKIEHADLREIALHTLEEFTLMHGPRFQLISPRKVEGDFSQDGLKRVLENLLSNAVKYGTPNRPIRTLLAQSRKRLRICVHNEGRPISEEEKAAIFETFGRLPSAHQSALKGWGLGLTLVRGIASAHGGRVWVTSAPTKGTTFTIEIPRQAQVPKWKEIA